MNPGTKPPHYKLDGSLADEPPEGSESHSLREMICVLGERMKHLATQAEVGGVASHAVVIEERMKGLATTSALAALASRIGIIEERMSHTATRAWVLGGVAAVLVGVLGGFWWIVQQYLSPLLQAAPHT